MTEYTNDYCPVEILGHGLSERTTRVRMNGVTAFILDMPEVYTVFSETMRYRMDDQVDPLDVREVKVVSHEEMASEDGSVSVVVEAKG